MSATRRSLPTGWLGGLGCGATLMVDPATLLFLAVLLSPTMLMRAADDRPERAGTRAVMLCNVAAVIGPLCRLWRNGRPTVEQALDTLSHLTVIAEAWLAASAGWLLSEALIFGARRVLSRHAAREIQAADAEIRKLLEEWGEPGGQHQGGQAPVPPSARP